jgi:UDP-N-acetylmuramoyl-tripeptide--D-alanyl-D-alanine ligase
LTAAAQQWRAAFGGCVIGIAGSNGKTTTKEMTAAILGQRAPCLATRGNFNNQIGVPLTLLRLTGEEATAVIEIGANRAGDVAELLRLVQPQVGVITNAGAEHLEGFGDLDGVARAEGEMVAGLPATGTAVLNADDAYFSLWCGMTAAKVVSFAIEAAADYRAVDLHDVSTGGGFAQRFTLQTPHGEQSVQLQVGGRHNVLNALAAAAAACSAGAQLTDVALGLQQMQPVAGRLQPRISRHGARLIDDSYNANPSSVRAGIDVITQLGGPAWLVLGDMGELGEQARDSHVQIGTYARQHGVQRVYATGPLSQFTVEAFGGGASWFPDVETMSRVVDAELTASVCLLVKGSRFNRLERVVAALTGQAQHTEH